MSELSRNVMSFLLAAIFIKAAVSTGADTSRWDDAWKRQVDVKVEETAGVARRAEAIEVQLQLGDASERRLKNELRVVDVVTGRQVPSQVVLT